MTEAQLRRLKAYKAALAHVEARRDAYGPEVAAVAAQLSAVLAEIQHFQMEQMNLRQTTGLLRRHTDRMRDVHMIAVARMARRVFRDDPEILPKFRVPHKRAPIDKIEEAAKTMVQALDEYHDFLITHGVAAERLDQLRAELQDLGRARAAADASTPRRTAATHKLKSLFSRASDDVRALDALIRASNPPDLRMWEVVSRVGKRIGRPRTRATRRAPSRNTPERR